MTMRWLCVEAHFLAGRYHGSRDDGRLAQWPPDPYRLFQALVAAGNLGFRRTEFSDAKKAALRWLERRPPPEILVPPARRANTFRLYVPNNDMDKVARAWAKGSEPEKRPAELRTDKDLRPHAVDGDATVRFLWPVEDDEWSAAQASAELVCAEARHLHALGLGIDLVVGQGRILGEAERRALAGDLWIADSLRPGWRVPAEGSLDELLARHLEQIARVQAGGSRGARRWVTPPAPPTVFREVEYRPRGAARSRPVHLFALAGGDGGYRSFDPRQAIEVAAWTRHAAHEIARLPQLKFSKAFVEEFVCGHGVDAESKNHRFSYLSLPTISPKGRDGRIRRVLLVEPPEGGGKEASALVRRLAGMPLVEEGTGEIKAELQPTDPFADGVAGRYLRKARKWGSVTPLVLPGRDDRDSRKAVGLVIKALRQAGYAAPVEEIHLQAEPVFAGAEMAARYRVPAYLKSFPRTHAIITFAEQISGPIALGAGRHIGLGVFAAMA